MFLQFNWCGLGYRKDDNKSSIKIHSLSISSPNPRGQAHGDNSDEVKTIEEARKEVNYFTTFLGLLILTASVSLSHIYCWPSSNQSMLRKLFAFAMTFFFLIITANIIFLATIKNMSQVYREYYMIGFESLLEGDTQVEIKYPSRKAVSDWKSWKDILFITFHLFAYICLIIWSAHTGHTRPDSCHACPDFLFNIFFIALCVISMCLALRLAIRNYVWVLQSKTLNRSYLSTSVA